jgi:C-terminal processing protease CtpA/Prc
MTGLDVVYNGKQLVKEQRIKASKDIFNSELGSKYMVNLITNYSYKLNPSFLIKSVLKNSPAEKAGLLKDDIIQYINNKPANELNLNEITLKFQEKDRKKIKITVDRNGEILKFEFRLEKKV